MLSPAGSAAQVFNGDTSAVSASNRFYALNPIVEEQSLPSQAATNKRMPITSSHAYFEQMRRMNNREEALKDVEISGSNRFYVTSLSQAATTALPSFQQKLIDAEQSTTWLAVNQWVMFEPGSRTAELLRPRALKNHPAVRESKRDLRRSGSALMRLQEETGAHFDPERLRKLVELGRKREARRIQRRLQALSPRLYPRRTLWSAIVKFVKTAHEKTAMHEQQLRTYFSDFRSLAGTFVNFSR